MAETFGRGAMTNHWNDIANSDIIMAIGSNPAENHPAAFGHIMTALDRGAKFISVDPRFTRTSAKADIYAPLRSGTDIAFINGMIKYVMDDIHANPGNYNMTYIVEYTNASHLINPGYKGPSELDGLHVMYILDDHPAIYGLPVNPQLSAATVAWQDVIQPLGWALGGVTILGLGLNYLVARANANKEEK